MAASVRIEDEAFDDARYDELAEYAGLADADHARGKMAKLWRQCTIEQSHFLSSFVVRKYLGPSGVEALVRARLGVALDGDRVRIRGTKGRIEWLKQLRENGKKGGRPPRVRAKPSGFESGKPSGSAELNPPAPAPAPAPALKNVSASPPTPSVPGYAEVIADFNARYVSAYSSKPTWNAKTGQQVKTLLKTHNAAEIHRRIENLFTAPPPWLKPPFDFGTLVQHFDKLVVGTNSVVDTSRQTRIL